MQKELVARDCPKCGGALELPPDFKSGTCKYCGSTISFPVHKVDYSVRNQELVVTIDGVETIYDSVDDLPENLRYHYLMVQVQRNKAYGPNGPKLSKIDVDGRLYNSPDELPIRHLRLLKKKPPPPPLEQSPGKPPPTISRVEHGKGLRTRHALEPTEHDTPQERLSKELMKYTMENPPRKGGPKLNYCYHCKKYVKTKMFDDELCKKCDRLIFKVWMTPKGEVKITRGRVPGT